jgi:DNA-binding MarR family transcriptional regulator
MADQNYLESFIGNSFRSVWSLEVLQFLADHPGASFTSEELIASLRVSDAVVSQSVDNLVAAGLAVVDREGRVAFLASTPKQAELVREAIDFFRRSPDKVRRLIVAQSAPGVTAFADAFKLRRD